MQTPYMTEQCSRANFVEKKVRAWTMKYVREGKCDIGHIWLIIYKTKEGVFSGHTVTFLKGYGSDRKYKFKA
jgi:hypothetical protein